MAAETLTGTRAAAGFPRGGKGDANTMKVAYGTYEIAANVEDGDIFEMCWLPAGATVIGGLLIGDDLDTGIEALDLDVGIAANGVDAANPDAFLNGGVLSGDAVNGAKAEAGICLPLQGTLAGGPQTFTVETKVQIEANAAAATGGTGTLTVYVYYVTD